jgi:cell fate regulator YaaT (PSP1 superfamily)
MIANPIREYLVNYGRAGDFSRFVTASPHEFCRGERVVVRTARGLELGTVLREATAMQGRVLKHLGAGDLVRAATAADETAYRDNQERGHQLFQTVRARVAAEQMPLEILDLDLLLDQQAVVLQYLAWEQRGFDDFWSDLSHTLGIKLVLEDLATPPEPAGCGEPNCGKTNGGCTDCSSGGGCSTGSCGSKGDVDLRDYFGHLRTKMEKEPRRIGLL